MATIDLEIGGHCLRVATDDPAAAVSLRAALHEHVRDAEFPIGFVLSRPSDHQQFFTVKDRSAYVLGRTTQLEQAVAILGGHLSALLPPPPDSARTKLRALVTPEGSVTCVAWPLLFAPPVIERRLHALGYAVIDRLVVDIDLASLRLTQRGVPWPALRELDPGVGHVQPTEQPLSITHVMVPTGPNPAPSTFAESVSFLAASLDPDLELGARLDLGERCAARFAEIPVPLIDRGSVYRALRR